MERYESYKDSGVEWIGGDTESLEYLRIENKGTRSIELEATTLHNSNATPSVHNEEQEYLSKLVDQMNERFGTDWRNADKIIRACADKIMQDGSFVVKARNNAMSDLATVFATAIRCPLRLARRGRRNGRGLQPRFGRLPHVPERESAAVRLPEMQRRHRVGRKGRMRD